MGGGGDLHHHGADGDFRSKVWSMTGGPYCRPKHWKRNTAIAMFGIFLVCIPIAMKSAELEDNLPAQQLISEWKLKARKEAGESIYGFKCQFHFTTALLMNRRISDGFSGWQRMTSLPDQKPKGI